jgi:hypothetical protein
MNYQQVDQIINSHGFANEPAFRDVTVSIAPIPNMDGCPLGLYYPGSGTIVVPPDAYPAVLEHELGHRYGHYHYNNLSEAFAESFRQKYQTGRAILYAGPDFARLPKMGTLFAEGQKGEVQLAFDRPLSHQALAILKAELHAQSRGEPIPRVYFTEDPHVIGLNFTRGVDWLLIIGVSLAALTVAGVGAIAYAIYKAARDTPWVFPLALFGTIAGTMLVAGWAGRRLIKA